MAEMHINPSLSAAHTQWLLPPNTGERCLSYLLPKDKRLRASTIPSKCSNRVKIISLSIPVKLNIDKNEQFRK